MPCFAIGSMVAWSAAAAVGQRDPRRGRCDRFPFEDPPFDAAPFADVPQQQPSPPRTPPRPMAMPWGRGPAGPPRIAGGMPMPRPPIMPRCMPRIGGMPPRSRIAGPIIIGARPASARGPRRGMPPCRARSARRW